MPPILMYHNVGAPGRSLNVSPQGLARQCRLLKMLGYHAITLRELAGHLEAGTIPPKAVVFTFDDALMGVYTHALSVLSRFGWRGTVFAVSQRLGQETEWATNIRHRVMSAQQLRELHDAGWEVGAHTRTHPHLPRLNPEEAWQEIALCREDLSNLLGEEVTTFCYPYGDLNEQVVYMVQQAGYRAACTTRKGLVYPDTDPYLLPRVHIAFGDGASGLLYRLWRAWRRTVRRQVTVRSGDEVRDSSLRSE